MIHRSFEANASSYLLRQPNLNYVSWVTESVSTDIGQFKGTNPALKKPSNIPEIYAKMFGRFH